MWLTGFQPSAVSLPRLPARYATPVSHSHQFYALVQPSLGDALSETVITVQPPIRLGCFIGVVLAMALWESLTPCRQ
jgi:hypothetical protein